MTHRTEDQDFCLYRDRGSSEALARVFDALAPRLLLLAAHLAPDAAQAEDLVQTTFLQAMRDAGRYDGSRPVAAWLAGILNHRALDARRRSGARVTQTLHDGMEIGDGAARLDPAQLAEDGELLERISKAIDEIDVPYRDVLSLRVVHGLTPTSIAHTLGRSPGTVRMQLKRGLERLRRAMPERTALFGVLTLEPELGLDFIRHTVLAKASAGVPTGIATSAVPIAPVVGGTLLMKVFIAVVVAVALGLGLYTFQRTHHPAQNGTLDLEREHSVLASTAGEAASAQTTAESVEVPAIKRAVVDVPAASEGQSVAGFQLRARFASDNSPAVGVGIYLRQDSGDALGTELRTDADGLVSFASLEAGRYLLHVDRLEQPLGLTLPYKGPYELLIPAGVSVRGEVLDIEGAGVQGAQVYCFNTLHHDIFQRLVKTGPGGRFEVRDLSPQTELLARIDGFQPSELETVRGRAGDSEEVKLVLGARGHRIHGRVLDPDGKPVPFALVAIGTDEDSRENLRGSVRDPAAQPGKPLDLEGVLLRADSDGVFESLEVPAGYALVIARPVDSTSNLVGHGSVWIRYGMEEEIVIRLTRGAVIEGVVRDKHGRPVAGARLEAEWEGSPLLGQMEDDVGPLGTDRFVVSDEGGRFRMVGLLAGDYDLRVEGTRERLVRAERDVGVGEVLAWNPVIESYASLSVRLLGPDGKPLAGWSIAANSTPGTAPGWSYLSNVTDREGRLHLADLNDGVAYELCAYAPDANERFNRLAAIVRAGVMPSGDEFVLHASRDEVRFGDVSGSWSGRAAQTERRPEVRLERVGRHAFLATRLGEDGNFAFRNLPQGSYTVSVVGQELPVMAFELRPGESKTLLK